MIYVKTLFSCIALASVVLAQIPNFGRCPEYDPMMNFDRENFLGKWYEVERYFAVSELASRCVSVTYERRADGNIYVNNEVTNRFTNVQRIVSGVVNPGGKSDVGTFTVKYSGIPVSYDTTLHVLDTDYDSFAVIWSCNSLAGPVGHTESVWVLARERLPDGPVLQKAYGVLDKYKISRTFFVKTEQTDCEVQGEPNEAIDGPDSGYDIVADDDAINTQYGHDKPQIHQVQHIANVETLQQFSPAYPVSPIYRPVIYNHGQTSNPYFKQNNEPALRNAANSTADGTESNSITNTIGSTPVPLKLMEKEVVGTGESENVPKNEQTEKIELFDEVSTTSDAKLEEDSTTKLPYPMDEVLASLSG